MFPSPIEPPIRHRCEIFGASCGWRRSSSAMLVSGPIGAMATGSGLVGDEAGHQRDGALGPGGRRSRRQDRGPDAALAVDLGRAHHGAQQRARGTLRHGDVVAAVGVQEPQRVLRAAGDVGVATDGGHGQQPDLRARRREADRQRVVQARVAVDDQRDRAVGGPERRRPLPRPGPVVGGDGVDRSPVLHVEAGAHRAQPWSYGWPAAAGPRTRPTTPATTTIVVMYGRLLSSCGGTSTPRIDSSAWDESAKPNTSAAPNA